MLDNQLKYAVVGASSDQEKYGFKVFKDLIDKGYNATPINPKGGHILNKKAYSSLTEMEYKPDMVIFVTPPEITEKILESVKSLKIKNVWMQPGAESEKSIEYCHKNNINLIHDACVIIKNQK